MSHPHHSLSAAELDEVLGSMRWLPGALAVGRGLVHLAPMSSEGYRRSPFLDGRAVTDGPGRWVAYAPILAAARTRSPGQRAWIFHTAYCGSTLLARHLEAFELGLVLKEPQFVTELAQAWPELAEAQRRDLVDLGRALLARAAEPVVIKARSLCNGLMAGPLTEGDRVLFLYGALEAHVLSVLQNRGRIAELGPKLAAMEGLTLELGPVAEARPAAEGPARRAAWLWLAHLALWRTAQARLGVRGRALAAAELFAAPVEASLDAARHLWGSVPDAGRARLLSAPVAALDAKTAGEAFSASARAAGREQTRAAHGAAIDEACGWAASLAQRWGLSPEGGSGP